MCIKRACTHLKSCVLKILTAKLKLSPMHQVLRELKKRNVRLKDLHALEVFGGTGELHTVNYAPQVSTLEVWEINSKCEKLLRRNLPMAKVKITDSYKEIKKIKKKYNLIIVDNSYVPNEDHFEHFDLFPDIFRVAMDSTIVILNIIPEINDAALKAYPFLSNKVFLARRKSFYETNHPEKLSFDELVKAYKKKITTNGFSLEWYFFQKRSFIYFIKYFIKRGFVYYIVLKIKKSGSNCGSLP